MVKKKRKKTTNPAQIITMVLLCLILGVLSIQVPDHFQELFNNAAPQKNVPTPPEVPTSTSKNPGPKILGAATFTSEELVHTTKGWIDYHALDDLERATGADALLTPDMVNTGTPANQKIRPVGFISGLEPYLHARGHLIGRQLGGSGDDPRNLTTLYQNPVNTPFMTKYENQIREALDHGETIRYRVIPIYAAEEALCQEIMLEAKGLETHSTVDFKITILNER